MAARETDSKPVEGPKAGSSRGRPPPEAVARALAEVEQTLERLKQVRAERAEAEQRFRTELEARDARIVELEADREAGLGRLAEFEARLAGAGAMETQRVSWDAKTRSIRAAVLGGWRGGVGAWLPLGDDAVEKLEALERRVGEFEAALDTERVMREVVEAKLAEAEGTARAHAERFRDQLLEAEQRERDLADARDRERREAEELAQQLREQLETATRAAASRAGELEAASSAANARLVELESLLAERAGEAEEAARNDAILSGKVAEQEAELSGMRAQLAQVREELAGARSEVQQREREIAERNGSADAETVALRSEVEKLRAEAAELWSVLESAETAAAERGQAAAEAEQRAEAVSAELTGALEAERGQVRELGEKLDLAADRLTELQSLLDERERMIEQSGEVDQTVALLTGQLNGLRGQLADAERQLDEARRAGGDRRPTPGHWTDDRIESRRRRLRRCRELLREREQHAASQQRVLAQRVSQCDEVLGRRRELVEARQIIERTHKKITSERARSGAAAVVFFAVATITVLSGLSWAVVTRTFPATAVLAADFTAEPAQPGDLEAWQAFHEELLLDPNVVARVSERMAQRGAAEFGQPAVLKAMLERDMTWSSPEDGKLAIEMRGLGREATARRLDTYVTTLAVEANALRQRRSEHSTTVVVEKARPGNEPLQDPRLQYAGVGLAGGSVFCLLLWFGIWKRMVHTKSAFEHAGEIDNLLEDARWVDPIQQIIDAREPKPGTKAA